MDPYGPVYRVKFVKNSGLGSIRFMAPNGMVVPVIISLIRIVVKAEIAEIARLLRINLDPETISLCCQLIEEGANPEALAAVIAELHKEMESLKTSH